MLMVGTILKNGLYAGLFSSFGALIITSKIDYLHNNFLVCLRFQIEIVDKNKSEINEKAIWEYLVCMVALFLATINYVG